ncbi:alpha/beta hydrolase [Vagococcus salmoninarum]|uniref:alpha/beta hydrolase n=1 Tax=Vagococcus salmoninarum TaxID=2739 RepID=UPI001880A5F2|nr:phospholipase [Vagococcus salmoninarum]MBE9387816.1 phospholipase [Vagococcus salmoninarum]
MQTFVSEKNSENLFVLFHGTGGNEFSLLFLTGELDPRASIISFLGDHGVGTERRYFKPLINGALDKTNFFKTVDDFLVEWDQQELSYSQITFIGYSNGANFIQGILSKRPDICQQTLLLHPQQFNLTFPALTNKSPNSLLLTTGANDPLVIPGDVLTLSHQLEQSFAKVKLILLDGEHGITDNEIAEIKQWFETAN